MSIDQTRHVTVPAPARSGDDRLSWRVGGAGPDVTATQPLPIIRPAAALGSAQDPEVSARIRPLVAQALDDLEEGRVFLTDALLLLACISWSDGRAHRNPR